MNGHNAREINLILAECSKLKTQGKLAEAQVFLNNICSLFPLDPVLNLNSAQNLKDLGHLDQAEKITDQFLRIDNNAAFLSLKSELLWGKGEQNASIDLILDSVANGIYNYDLVLHAALFMLEKQEHEQAAYLVNNFLNSNKLPRREHNRLKTILLIIDYLTNQASAKTAANLAKSAAPGQSNDLGSMLDIYALYINSLLSRRAANPELYTETGDKIYIIGDSHTLSPAYLQVEFRGRKYNIIPKLIFGAKAFHFAQNQPKTRIEGFLNIIKSLPEKSTIFISLGEIDCRITEGFFSQYLKDKNFDLQTAITKTVAAYIDFIQKHAGSHDVYFFSVPGPNPAFYTEIIARLNPEQQATYLTIAPLFNKTLKQKTGAKYIDLYTPTLAANGAGDPKHFIDNAHLLPDIYSQIIKSLT